MYEHLSYLSLCVSRWTWMGKRDIFQTISSWWVLAIWDERCMLMVTQLIKLNNSSSSSLGCLSGLLNQRVSYCSSVSLSTWHGPSPSIWTWGYQRNSTKLFLIVHIRIEVRPNYVLSERGKPSHVCLGCYMPNNNSSHHYYDSDSSRASWRFKKWKQGWAREAMVITPHYYLIWSSRIFSFLIFSPSSSS